MNDFFAIFSVVSSAVTVISFAYAVVMQRRNDRLQAQLRDVSWQDLDAASQHLASGLRKRQRPVGLIVTPGPWGAVVSGLVAKALGEQNPPVAVWITRPTGEQASSFGQVTIASAGPKWTVYATFVPDPQALVGDVVILDDFVRAGDFMSATRAFLLEHGFAEDRIVTAAVVVSSVAESSGRTPTLSWRGGVGAQFSFPWGPAA